VFLWLIRKSTYPKSTVWSVKGLLAGGRNGRSAGMRLNTVQSAAAVINLVEEEPNA